MPKSPQLGRPRKPKGEHRVPFHATVAPITASRIKKYQKPKQPIGHALDTAMAMLEATKSL